MPNMTQHPLEKTWKDIDRAVKRLAPLGTYDELVEKLIALRDLLEEMKA